MQNCKNKIPGESKGKLKKKLKKNRTGSCAEEVISKSKRIKPIRTIRKKFQQIETLIFKYKFLFGDIFQSISQN